MTSSYGYTVDTHLFFTATADSNRLLVVLALVELPSSNVYDGKTYVE